MSLTNLRRSAGNAAPYAALHAASWLVPHTHRKEWLAEWKSELWYVTASRMAFCSGAFLDAFWLRRNASGADPQCSTYLDSPVSCGLALTFLAIAGWLAALLMPEAHDGKSLLREQLLLPHLLILSLALLILPATTSLQLGEYPASSLLSWRRRSGRWILLAIKIGLCLSIVFCGFLILISLGLEGIAAQCLLAGYIFALRWALSDQRRRCPVCLHLLTNPIRIGQPSHILLAWYGMEFLCRRGHGLLHVPEISSSCFSAQRWTNLDSSWRSLFGSTAGSHD